MPTETHGKAARTDAQHNRAKGLYRAPQTEAEWRACIEASKAAYLTRARTSGVPLTGEDAEEHASEAVSLAVERAADYDPALASFVTFATRVVHPLRPQPLQESIEREPLAAVPPNDEPREDAATFVPGALSIAVLARAVTVETEHRDRERLQAELVRRLSDQRSAAHASLRRAKRALSQLRRSRDARRELQAALEALSGVEATAPKAAMQTVADLLQAAELLAAMEREDEQAAVAAQHVRTALRLIGEPSLPGKHAHHVTLAMRAISGRPTPSRLRAPRAPRATVLAAVLLRHVRSLLGSDRSPAALRVAFERSLRHGCALWGWAPDGALGEAGWRYVQRRSRLATGGATAEVVRDGVLVALGYGSRARSALLQAERKQRSRDETAASGGRVRTLKKMFPE